MYIMYYMKTLVKRLKL